MSETVSASEQRVLDVLRVAYLRAAAARVEAAKLLEAGFAGPSLVWSVRAAEILVRDFHLLPHFLEAGHDWNRAVKEAAGLLGNSNWSAAFAAAEEWYGPFDVPLTDDEQDAWQVWKRTVVRRRGDVVHGRPVVDVTSDEAAGVLAFTERMATWYSQRFLTSPKHPIGAIFRQALEGRA